MKAKYCHTFQGGCVDLAVLNLRASQMFLSHIKIEGIVCNSIRETHECDEIATHSCL